MEIKPYIRTPILVITFNRPDLTKLMLEHLAQYRIDNLMIVSDGPRNENDIQLIEASRQIISEMAPKNSELIFRKNNLGCKINMHTSLMHAINKHDKLIVLEDDCLPTKYFFEYCESMLDLHEFNHSISHISGCNPQDFNSTENIFLSKYPRVWGWACWKRTLVDFRCDLTLFSALSKHLSFIDRILHLYFFYCITIKKVDTWDYQFLLHILTKGHSIVPTISLVENLGFRADATHTTSTNIAYKIQNASVDYEASSCSYDNYAKKADFAFSRLLLPKIIRRFL